MSTLKMQFDRVCGTYEKLFLHAPVVPGSQWQSIVAPQDMVEVFNQSFTLYLEAEEDLGVYREAIGPSLPWADRHFEKERVSGEPINPGETWKEWPYGRSAAAHLKAGQFDHSYAERYWPQYAGKTPDGHLADPPADHPPLKGIRYDYGDLEDLVSVLVSDPLTRQAYLPIFFPEDLTAALAPARVPCTLGYHFIQRQGQLHVIYPMRSCDFIRHFRDDVYLTVRLLLWVLAKCQARDPETWGSVTPGTFRMHITSLHMFVMDRQVLASQVAKVEAERSVA